MHTKREQIPARQASFGDRLTQFRSALEAIGGIFGNRPHHGRLQFCCHENIALYAAHRGWWRSRMGLNQLEYGQARAEWISAGKHLVHDDTERINVRTFVLRLAHALLRTHIRRASPELAAAREPPAFLIEFRETEVDHLNESIVIIEQDNVARLDIAVYDAVAMSIVKSTADLCEYAAKQL